MPAYTCKPRLFASPIVPERVAPHIGFFYLLLVPLVPTVHVDRRTGPDPPTPDPSARTDRDAGVDIDTRAAPPHHRARPPDSSSNLLNRRQTIRPGPIARTAALLHSRNAPEDGIEVLDGDRPTRHGLPLQSTAAAYHHPKGNGGTGPTKETTELSHKTPRSLGDFDALPLWQHQTYNYATKE